MGFDALAAHASADERRALLQTHSKTLLAMGLVVGLLGAAPSLLWSVGLMAIAMAPVLVPLSIWIYTLIFIFSSLWFVHFCLEALQALRHKVLDSDTREGAIAKPFSTGAETAADTVPPLEKL
jgi:cation transport ATPase